MPTTAPPAGTTGLTYADLLELPEPADNQGTRYELLDGELLVLADGTYGPPSVVLAEGEVVSAALPGLRVPAAEALALEDG